MCVCVDLTINEIVLSKPEPEGCDILKCLSNKMDHSPHLELVSVTHNCNIPCMENIHRILESHSREMLFLEKNLYDLTGKLVIWMGI